MASWPKLGPFPKALHGRQPSRRALSVPALVSQALYNAIVGVLGVLESRRNQLISSSSVLHAGILCCHTLHSASVGDIRAARSAGHNPATAPMTTDAPIPPPQASGGMTTPQCLLEA